MFEARQLRNLEKTFGGDVRVCDRTALILDIFNQRAATREAALQVIYLSGKHMLSVYFLLTRKRKMLFSGHIGSDGVSVTPVNKNVDPP